MKINDLKLEHVYRIFQIYEKHAGIEMPDYVSPYDVYLELLDAKEDPSAGWDAADGYRVGSKFTGHSKLAFVIHDDGDLQLMFRPNLDRRYLHEAKLEPRANATAERFSGEVKAYFDSVANGKNNTPEDLQAREYAEDDKKMFAKLKKSYLENPTKGTEWQQGQNKRIYGREII